MVKDSREYGISYAARKHKKNRSTVRKWRDRWSNPRWLADRFFWGDWHPTRSPPNQISPELEMRIVEIREKTGDGPAKIFEKIGGKCSKRTISRILRRHGQARKWGPYVWHGELTGRKKNLMLYLQLIAKNKNKELGGNLYDFDRITQRLCHSYGLPYETDLVKRCRRYADTIELHGPEYYRD